MTCESVAGAQNWEEIINIVYIDFFPHRASIGLITSRNQGPKGKPFTEKQEALGQRKARTTLGISGQSLLGIQLEALSLHSTMTSAGIWS